MSVDPPETLAPPQAEHQLRPKIMELIKLQHGQPIEVSLAEGIYRIKIGYPEDVGVSAADRDRINTPLLVVDSGGFNLADSEHGRFAGLTPGREVVLGRPGNAKRFTFSDYISHDHLKITAAFDPTTKGYMVGLVDLGSKNGTWVKNPHPNK